MSEIPGFTLVATAWRMDAAIHLYDNKAGRIVCGADAETVWVIEAADRPTCRGCGRAFNREFATHPLDR
jgi:transposase-like protein